MVKNIHTLSELRYSNICTRTLLMTIGINVILISVLNLTGSWSAARVPSSKALIVCAWSYTSMTPSVGEASYQPPANMPQNAQWSMFKTVMTSVFFTPPWPNNCGAPMMFTDVVHQNIKLISLRSKQKD